MRCPNCGANVASGDFCDRCGASLPVSVGASRRQPPRSATSNKSANRPAKEKRSGTLGDLFKTGSPFTGPQPAQKPARSRGQTFLAWRDARRNDAAAAAAPPQKPARRPPSPPSPPPMWEPSPSHTPQSPDYAPGGQIPFAPTDPWHGTYDAPPAAGMGAPPMPAAAQADPWDSDRAWNVLPQSGLPSGPISGSSSGWRNRPPMVDLIDEDVPAWAAMPRYGQDGTPARRVTRARRAAANVSRATLNVLLIGLILLILAIPISIGLTHLASLQPQSPPTPRVSGTAVPTAPVANNFTGYAVSLFSLSYPSAWKHATTTLRLSDGTAANEDTFTDGKGTTAALYTTLGTADLLQPYLDELASYTAVNAALQPIVLGTTRTYNGVKWVESDYTFSGIINGKPATMQMRVLAAIQGATAYFLVLTAPQTSFGHANSANFEPLLSSFRFN
ncbi:MAG: hypothetical protein ACRDHP_16740 [Ktedonobacterales bacterium]